MELPICNVATPLLREQFMPKVGTDVIGKGLAETSNHVDNARLIEVNDAIHNHPVEYIGEELRGYDGYEAYFGRWLIITEK